VKQSQYTWLPASTPDVVDFIEIRGATGSYLINSNGDQIYDAVSSWWCKPLGHCHPLVKESIYQQLELFEHHIPANASNEVIEALSARLTGIFSSMDRVMYASDGSCAVEIAMKLSYESRVLNGQSQRNKFISLSGAYHGETILALSVCGIDGYKKNYRGLMAENYLIDNIPYVLSRNDRKWSDYEFDYSYYQELFEKLSATATALLIEPIVQGANGLRIISRDYLGKLVELAHDYDLHVICDEIMVGLGRLGCYSVSKDYLGFEPDMVCFAKNLTAGSIPMSVVVVNQCITEIYRRNDKIFPHSHTHSCNALAARVALNYLDYLDNSSLLTNVLFAENELLQLMQSLALRFDFICNPRAIGAIAACDLDLPEVVINRIFSIGLKHQIYLRPIGKTLYVMPPLNNLIGEIQIISVRLVLMLSDLQKWE